MSYINPPLGTKGRWILQAPWNVTADTPYELTSTRKLGEFHQQKQDPYALIYQPYEAQEGDLKQTFLDDMTFDVPIFTLTADGGATVYVPADQVTSVPGVDQYAYRRIVLSVDLGMLETSTNISQVADAIKQSVLPVFGVDPTIFVHDTPMTQMVSAEDHYQNITNRYANITQNKTYKALYEETLTINTQLIAQNQSMYALLQANGIVLPPLPTPP